MPIGIQLLQHTDTDTVYRYRGPVWVDDIDPVWIRWPRKGHHNRQRSLSRTVIVPSGTDSIWHRSLSRIVTIPSGINRQKSLSRTVIVPSGTHSYFPYPLLRYS